MSDLIQTALELRIVYGWSVFPITPGSKRPFDQWKGFQHLRINLPQIRAWEPNWNCALATGELSGVVVVDCESEEDAEWFMSERGGVTPFTVRTPRGVHLYFRHPGQRVPLGARFTDDSGRSRYDVRGDGGYVLLPPSRVEANGKDIKQSGEYRFESDLDALRHLPVFRMEWRPASPSSGLTANVRSDKRGGITNGERYIAHIRATAGQGGHNETYRAVCKLKESGLDELQAFAAISAWNQTNADPMWSQAELLHKIKSVYS